MADKIAEGMIEFYRAKLAESERAGMWEPKRVVLERNAGQPGRPSGAAGREVTGAYLGWISGQVYMDQSGPS